MPTSGELSLYIHVPFCTKKCDYCHFFVVPNRENLQQEWFLSLKREWELRRPIIEKHTILTLYFGGGTPSLLPPAWIKEIISWTGGQPKEITLEVNPDDATLEKLQAFFEAGVNRRSIGIQTFVKSQLTTLGRLHTSDKGKQTILDAYEAGFRNISCDLMYDLPSQTLADWERNLDIIATLPITHLSLYNLTIEPNTAFYRQLKRLKPLLPPDTLSRQMYLTAIDKLTRAGFEQYEISAFCRDGLQSLHNIGYWLGRPFLGLGPSAFSYYEGRRFQNAASISKPGIAFEEELEPGAARRELFAIQLRLRQGINIARFETQFGPLDAETKATLQKLQQLGWIENALNHPRLTKEGILFYDSIAEELI